MPKDGYKVGDNIEFRTRRDWQQFAAYAAFVVCPYIVLLLVLGVASMHYNAASLGYMTMVLLIVALHLNYVLAWKTALWTSMLVYVNGVFDDVTRPVGSVHCFLSNVCINKSKCILIALPILLIVSGVWKLTLY